MKLGQLELGQPIEFGFTGENQFYYPGRAVLPNNQGGINTGIEQHINQNFDPTAPGYVNAHPHYGSISEQGNKALLKKYRSESFHTLQSYISPGTAIAYGTIQNSKEKPLSSNGEDFINNYYYNYLLEYQTAGFTPLGLSNANNDGYGCVDYEYGPFMDTRFNTLYHNSLFEELICYNYKIAGNSPDVDFSINTPLYIKQLLQFFFLGKQLSTGASYYQDVEFKFVEAGQPYVKFRIDGAQLYNGMNVSTSDNLAGKVDYYMLFNTYNHIPGFDQNALDNMANAGVYLDPQNPFYTLVPNTLDGAIDYESIFNLLNVSDDEGDGFTFNQNYLNLYNAFDSQGFTIPTLIADFRNPIMNVEWEDTIVANPANTEHRYQRYDVYPLPGQHNPENSPFKNKNSWCGLSVFDEESYTARRFYNMSFKYMGCQPEFFTIDNLYAQDYDIMNRAANITNGGKDWLAQLYKLTSAKEDIRNDWITLYGQVSQYDAETIQPIPESTIGKIYVMMQRVIDWADAIDEDYAVSFPPREESFDTSTAVGAALGEYNPPQYIPDYDGQQHGHTIFGAPKSSYSGWYNNNNTRIANICKRLGSPAPMGYVPKCGYNYADYFGIQPGEFPTSYDTGPGFNLGNTHFEFNGGLKIGSTENIETLLNFDLSTLVEDFQLSNYLDSGVVARYIFDREINKIFYHVTNALTPRLEEAAYNQFREIAYPSEPLQIPLVENINVNSNIELMEDNITIDTQEIFLRWEYDDLDLNEDTPIPGTLAGTVLNRNRNIPIQVYQIYRVSEEYAEIANTALENGTFVTQIDSDFSFESFIFDGKVSSTDWDTWSTTEFNTNAGTWPSYLPPGSDSIFIDHFFANDNFTFFNRLEKGRLYKFRVVGLNLETDIEAAQSNALDHPFTNPTLEEGPYAGFPYMEFGTDDSLGDEMRYRDTELGYTQTRAQWYREGNDNNGPLAPESYNLNNSPLAFKRPADVWLPSKLLQLRGNLISFAEYDMLTYLSKVSLGLKEMYPDFGNISFNGIPTSRKYMAMQTLFVNTSNVNFDFYLGNQLYNTTGESFNPYLDDGWQSTNYLNYHGMIRDIISLLSFYQGGIEAWELNNFKNWLETGATQWNPNLPPFLAPPEFFEVDSPLPDFTSDELIGQSINPASADNNGIMSLVYNGPNLHNNGVPGNTWWKVCDYLNEFPELTDGSIDYITRVGDNFGNGEVIYTPYPFSNEQGETIPKGFYPSDPSLPINANSAFAFFIPGNTIGIKFAESFTATAIGGAVFTSAFGPEPDPSGNIFPAGYTFYQMVNELIQDGITGTMIDESNPNSDTNQGDGVLTIQDGLQYFEQSGDVRPYQLINFCYNNSIIELLHFFLPTTDFSPNAPDLSGGSGFFDSPIARFVAPNAVGVFDGVTNVVRSFSGNQENISLSTGRYTDYFSTTGENIHQSVLNPNKTIVSLDDVNRVGAISGDEIFTQSINPTNTPYYHTLTKKSPDLASSEDIFDVSWGHIAGSGSLVKNNGKSPSEAVYRQAANELLGDSSGSFYSVSQSVYAQTGISIFEEAENSHLPYMSDNPSPDEYVYILRTKQHLQQGASVEHKFQDQILHLSGSDASGDGVLLKLGRKLSSIGHMSSISQEPFHYLFDVTDRFDSNIETARRGVFGYYFPRVGTWILNQKINEIIDGAPSATGTVTFGDDSVANNTLSPNGIAKADKEYNNALKLANCLQNNASNIALEGIMKDEHEEKGPVRPQKHVAAIIRLNENQFNYTTNSTIMDENEDGIFNTFQNSMTYNEDLRTGPTTYISQVVLYDNEGYEIAVANLSTPIRKDFFRKVIIKVLISV